MYFKINDRNKERKIHWKPKFLFFFRWFTVVISFNQVMVSTSFSSLLSFHVWTKHWKLFHLKRKFIVAICHLEFFFYFKFFFSRRPISLKQMIVRSFHCKNSFIFVLNKTLFAFLKDIKMDRSLGYLHD